MGSKEKCVRKTDEQPGLYTGTRVGVGQAFHTALPAPGPAPWLHPAGEGALVPQPTHAKVTVATETAMEKGKKSS